MLTYNVKLQFENEEDKDFWLSLLDTSMSVYNYISELYWENKGNTYLGLKPLHQLCYYKTREKFPSIPSQIVIKNEQAVLSNYKANKGKFKVCQKNPALRLDIRLYSNLTKDSIKLVSSKARYRCKANFVLYPKFIELASKFNMADPLIFNRGGELFLSVSFKVPEKPIQDYTILGVDLGIRRFFTTSDGDSVKGTLLNKIKRKIRYQRRYNQKHIKSHSARKNLKKHSRHESNLNKQFCHMMANQILKTNKSVIVLEDLTGIKHNTSKSKEGFKRTKHNNRISQVPFYLFKQILSYKATHLGKNVVTVPPKNTSKTNCISGKMDGERKGCRYYTKSGLIFDADFNASINIALKYNKHSISLSEPPLDGTLNFLDRVLSTTQSSVLSHSKCGKPDCFNV